MEILNYIYWEVTVGLVVMTSVINNMFGIRSFIHSKWLLLALTIFAAVVHRFTHIDTSLWRVMMSLGAAMILYNYIAKPLLDVFYRRKNPLL